MELLTDSKRVVYKLFFSVLFYVIVLWFSIFLYGITYYLYIPAIAHVKPVYFQYSPLCRQLSHSRSNFKSDCPFPSANVSLVQSGHYELLSQSQIYTVELTLDMPESEANREQGMFMIYIDMVSKSGEILQTSARPAILPYKSALFKTIYTFFFAPCLLAGTVEEKQTLVIPIFEEYQEDSYRPTHSIRIELQSRIIEVYYSSIRIHAQFTGLRYFMYYWPLLSAIMGVFSNFFFLSMTVLFTWLRYSIANGDNNVSGEASQQRPFQTGENDVNSAFVSSTVESDDRPKTDDSKESEANQSNNGADDEELISFLRRRRAVQ